MAELPVADDLIAPTVTENQFKVALKSLVENVASKNYVSGEVDGAITLSKKYTDIINGIVFKAELGATDNLNTRVNRAIKSVSLRGDFNEKLITLAALSYSAGVFTIIFARPDSKSEVMSSATNTKYVARYNGSIAFNGVQVLQLENYGNSANAEISGSVTIDFDKLLSTDVLSANYIAQDRLISTRDIINLNATYNAIKSVKNSVGLVIGSDAKNAKLNDTLEDLVFFKSIPANKYMILAGLFYSATDPTLVQMQIFASDDKVTKGILWAQGSGTVGIDNKVLIIFDQGYATVKMDNYYPSNVGAAILGDNATYETRGINRQLIKNATLDNTVTPRYPNQFMPASTFSLPLDYLQRSVKLYIKGNITTTDYYLLSVFNWSFTSGKYRLTYQVRKMTTPDQLLADGMIVYNGFIEFDNITDIKGIVTVTPAKTNSHPLDAEIDIDLSYLKYRTDNNNIFSPMIFNPSTYTFATRGFDVQKLKQASATRFVSSGGLTKYATLKDAVAVSEKGLFAIGGNLFKSKVAIPLIKSDLVCVNNPARLMSRKPKQKEYDFYYKGVKTRLEIIDAEDNFYFVNSSFIVKSPHPIKQVWTSVTNATAADLVVFDVAAGLYYSISNRTELFTAAALSATTITQARLTYDDELFIITTSTNKAISITENGQTSLRSFNFNGAIGTKYIFGAGVSIIKDWCMTHHKNVMFVSDYDLGVDGVRGTTGGQKCYVSLDNGYTFSKCFDFGGGDWSNVINASNITAFGASQAHIHSVVYDPKQNVVWLITGDGAVSADNSSIFWSRDLGQTWTHKRSTVADTGARTQLVVGLPFDGCMSFGTDASNINGTTVITYDADTMVQEQVKNYASKSDLLCFARSVWSRPTSKVKYMSFGKNSAMTADLAAESFVVASSNGYDWERVWVDNNPDIYGNVFCYDDSNGKLYISLDGNGAYKERVLILNVGFI